MKYEHLRPVWVLQLNNADLISAFACDARKTRAADDVADMCGANLIRRPPAIFYDEICRRYRDGTMTNDDFIDHPAYNVRIENVIGPGEASSPIIVVWVYPRIRRHPRYRLA